MANVTKQDLFETIANSTGLTQTDVKIGVEAFLEVVSDTLVHGKSIEIRGFGTFLSKERKSRPARNPKTGDVVMLEERTVPLFKFSSDLRKKIDLNASSKAVETATNSSNTESDDEVLY